MALPETKVYGPTKQKLTPERQRALENQYEAMKLWQIELLKRYSVKEIGRLPHEVPART